VEERDVPAKLRELAAVYERASTVPDLHTRVEQLYKAKQELNALLLQTRDELTRLVMQARTTPKPRRRNPWFDIEPDEAILSYWTSRKMTRRAAKTLAKLGIKDLKTLSGYTEMDMLRNPQLGRATLKEMKEVLADHGLSFGIVYGESARATPG
jgi:DNA-directed RNA polymerase alpha subunit